MKKSITEIAWNVEESEYRKNKNVSYSLLSSYDREGQKALLDIGKKKDSEALRFGSLTDVIVTEPHELDNRFVISDIKKPTDAIFNIIIDIFNNEDYATFDEIPKEVLLKYINERNYQSNWGEDARINRITVDGKEYYNLLSFADDKTIMAASDFELANSCVDTLKTNNWTSKYFEENDMFNEDIEAHYQLKFKLSPEQSKIKIPIGIRCMFDRIVVDHKNKTIQPIDLKTTGKPEESFDESFLQWRYDLQATMYWYILWSNCQLDDYFKDFTVLPFKFICINRWNKTPLIWEYPECTIFKRKKGSDNKIYKPWTELLVEVAWFFEYKQYDYSYESYQQEGERKLINNLKVI